MKLGLLDWAVSCVVRVCPLLGMLNVLRFFIWLCFTVSVHLSRILQISLEKVIISVSHFFS